MKFLMILLGVETFLPCKIAREFILYTKFLMILQ